jgi:protocatechuate 3,4-dioxygenase beta subunit
MRANAAVAIALFALAVIPSWAEAQTAATPGQQQRTPPRERAPDQKGTASIKGRVLSAEGERPLRRAQISLSAPELTDRQTTSTNTLGVYEFNDLPAGRYTITVRRGGYLSLQYGQRRPGEPPKPLQIADGEKVDKLDFALPRASVISGRITDETGDPFAGVNVYAMQRQFYMGRRKLVPISSVTRSDDTGQYRIVGLPPGDYIVMAQVGETWATDGEKKEVFAYAPTYPPGTASAADAQRIKVGLGQEVGAIDIMLIPVRAATISGMALASDGTPLAGGSVGLSLEIQGPGGGSFSSVVSASIAPDGTWRLRNVPPGEFQLTARSSSNRERPAETAAMTLVVQGVDLEGITLMSDPGGTLTGQVVTDDGSPPPEGRGRMRIFGQTVVPDRRGNLLLAGDDNGVVGRDGAFTLKHVSGPAMLQVWSLPKGWAVKSIEVGDQDYVDAPIEIRGGRTIDGARVVLSSRFPTVTGRITDEKGNPAEGTVLLFPREASKWLQAAGTLRTARPDQSGTVRFETVRPGDYLMIALDYVEQWQVNDPEFLEELRGRAASLKLDEGEAEAIALKVIKR